MDKVVPVDAEVRINDKVYRVGRYSLKAKRYFINKHGLKEFVIYLNEQIDIASAEIIYYLIDDNGKKDFPTFDAFLEAFSSSADDLMKLITTFNVIMGYASQAGATDAEVLENTPEKKT